MQTAGLEAYAQGAGEGSRWAGQDPGMEIALSGGDVSSKNLQVANPHGKRTGSRFPPFGK
jgi:hypothetical protein